VGCNPKLAGRTRATQVANHIQPGGWVGELEFLQGAEREASTTTSVMAMAPRPLPYKVDTSRPSLRTNWTRLGRR
jgi:hypothetical protein